MLQISAFRTVLMRLQHSSEQFSETAEKKCLLIQSSKVGVNSFVKVCGANEFNMVITDCDCAEEQITALEATGVKVIVAEE